MYLVVGAGLAGAVMAERIANVLRDEVVVVERRDCIGGNVYDYENEHGITVHRYGPHIFHTRRTRVWEYLSHFTGWQPYFHQVHAVIDGHEISLPFNLDSLYQVFSASMATRLERRLVGHYSYGASVSIFRLRNSEDAEIRGLGDYVYDRVFLGYTMKQWGRNPEELDPSVVERVPVRISRGSNYFEDPYQAIPASGYTAMVANLLDHPLIRVQRRTDFKDLQGERHHTKLIYTGQVDEFYGFRFGVLPYRSLAFEFEAHNKPFWQSVAQVNYPNDYDFTRITEFKYFLREEAAKTVVAYEYPQEYVVGKNDPFYPIPARRDDPLLRRYQALSVATPDVVFVGRLARYRYLNMDEVVDMALQLFEREIAR